MAVWIVEALVRKRERMCVCVCAINSCQVTEVLLVYMLASVLVIEVVLV